MQTINQDHCQACGETSLEYINPHSNYSSCCNEGIITPLPGEECDEYYCSHPDPSPEELAAKAEQARAEAIWRTLIGTTVRTTEPMRDRFAIGDQVEILDIRFGNGQTVLTYFKVKTLGQEPLIEWLAPAALDLPTS